MQDNQAPSKKQYGSWVPYYDSTVNDINAIKRLLVIPCTVPAWVFAEAAVSGIVRAATSIIEPDPKEVYHQVIGNSLYHNIKQTLEEVNIVPPREESKATRFFFELADFVDVSLWFMFLFGAASDGLWTFTTQVQRYTKCEHKGSHNFGQGGPYINAIPDSGDWGPDLFTMQLGDGTTNDGPAAFTAGPTKSGTIAASCAFATFGGESVETDTAALEQSTLQVQDIGSSNIHGDPPITMSKAWLKKGGGGTYETNYAMYSRYTQGIPLPLHEAFRDGDNWFGMFFQGTHV